MLTFDDEKELLLQQLSRTQAELTVNYNAEVKRTQEATASSIKPRSIDSMSSAEEHKKWQAQQLAYLKQEYEAQLKEETTKTQASIEALTEKWARLGREKDHAAARQIRETLLRHGAGGAAGEEEAVASAQQAVAAEHDLRLRCSQLEHAYQESLAQIAKLTELVREVNLRSYVTHGKWLHRSCYTDATEPVLQFINKVQPLPTAILGCVRLPYLHVWMRDEGQPTGMTYALDRQLFNAEKTTTMLSTGLVVFLGATSAGEAFFLKVNNPVTLPDLLKMRSQRGTSGMDPGLSAGDFDIAGAALSDEELRRLFHRFEVDEKDDTVDAAQVVATLVASAAHQALDRDHSVGALLERYHLPAEGRMTFEQFALLVLQKAQQ
eukprot:RCo013342